MSASGETDSNPKTSQAAATDAVLEMLTGSLGRNPDSQEPLSQMALQGLREIAAGFVSPDLTEKARAIRSIEDMTPSSTAGEKRSFEATTFSPEEIRSGLTPIVNTFSGKPADRMRAIYGIDKPAAVGREAKTATGFDPEEEVIALGLIWLGLGYSQAAEQKHEVIKPGAVWSEENVQALQKQLAKEGVLKGGPKHQAAVVASAKARLTSQLQGSIAANEAARRRLDREITRHDTTQQ